MADYSKLAYLTEKYRIILKLLGLTDKGIKKLEEYPIKFLKGKLREIEKSKGYLQHSSLFEFFEHEFNLIQYSIESDVETLDNYKEILILIEDPFYYIKEAVVGNNAILENIRKNSPHLERFFDYLDSVEPGLLESVNVDDCEEEIKEVYYEGKINKGVWEEQQG